MNKLDSVSQKFDPSFSVEKRRPITLGLPMTKQEKDAIPRILRIAKPRSQELMDILGWGSGPWFVSQPIRDKIEELEPDVHEFIPVEIKRDDGSCDFGTYYLILLTQALDAIVPDKTEFHEGIGEEAAKRSAYYISEFARLITLKESIISGHHLWRGAGPGNRWSDYFCSDALGDFILENGFRGWRLTKCQVED